MFYAQQQQQPQQQRRRRGKPQTLPQKVLFNILWHLPTDTLFTASLVSSEWRKLIFGSGRLSNSLLRPHLSVLRERFGFEQVPHRLPVSAVRQLLLRYAKQELPSTLCAKEIYDTKACTFGNSWRDDCSVPLSLRRFAVCGSLFAIAMKSKHIYVFELTKKPMELLARISVTKYPIALAISEAYLAILDDECISMYSLLARNTPSFMVIHIYTVKIPQIRHPSAIAITPGLASTPLVSVLASSIYLIHPSYALTQKRGGFFRSHDEEEEEEEEEVIIDVSRKGKEKEKLPLTHSPSSPRRNPWLLSTAGSGIGASFPLTFTMCGRQVSVSARGDNNSDFERSGFIGGLWSNEDPEQLEQRNLLSLKEGENVQGATYATDQIWRFYTARLSYKKRNLDGSTTPIGTARNRWQVRLIDTGDQMPIESAIHLYDSFYIVTEVTTKLVRIISMAPFTSKMILYRRFDSNPGSDSTPNSDPNVIAVKTIKHCGYVVVPGGKDGGYIAYNHRPGFIKILPIRRILMHVAPDSSDEQQMRLSRQLTEQLREIAIGEDGDIVGMAGDPKRLVVVMEHRVVVVRLWCEDAPGRSVGSDIEPDWVVNGFGGVRKEGERMSLLRWGLSCGQCVVQ